MKPFRIVLLDENGMVKGELPIPNGPVFLPRVNDCVRFDRTLYQVEDVIFDWEKSRVQIFVA